MGTRFPLALLPLVTLASWTFCGCGGGETGGEGGAAGNTSTSTSTTSETTGTAGNGGTGGGAGGTTGAAAGGSGGAGGSGSSSGGAGGGGGAPGVTVACDALTCSIPSTFCCQNYNQPAECLPPGSDCGYGVPLTCDGPEDCQSGQVCCAQIETTGPANAYVSVDCAATCEGKDFRVVCGASGECPQGKSCGTSDMLPPYLDCK